jgi:hypothetical protein
MCLEDLEKYNACPYGCFAFEMAPLFFFPFILVGYQ